jgi:hypothetical protein
LNSFDSKNESSVGVDFRVQAERELEQEEYRALVEREKAKLRDRKKRGWLGRLWDRIFPYRLVRKENT